MYVCVHIFQQKCIPVGCAPPAMEADPGSPPPGGSPPFEAELLERT